MAEPTCSEVSMENENDESKNENNTSDSFDVLSKSKALLAAALKATKAASKIPSAGEQYNFYNNFGGFRQLMGLEGKTVLDMMTRILQQQQGCRGTFHLPDLDDKYEMLVEANDTLLEKVGTALDEASGIKKKEEAVLTTIKFTKPINTSWNRKSSPRGETFSLLAARNVQRPQLRFSRKVDNSNSPFVPSITYKPHSIKPLSILLEMDEEGHEVFSHPYEFELERFEGNLENLERSTPKFPKKLEDTELVFVKTANDLAKMCADLSQTTEFAVDVENHSYRSFQGFTCLIQISSRDRDYIVDTLELRDEMCQLNEVFTNPKILKVLHGSDMDVHWLQRDFGVYLVNLFDTGQASRVLNYSHFSLAFLLKHFCQVDPDKSFQLADWRIRPLTESMVLYARQDTHYLLYIYECLKNELLDKGNAQKNLLLSVMQRSRDICLKRYQKPLLGEDTYLNLYRKSRKRFNTRQLYALKELYTWRDKLARQEDESYGYVLPNHMMLQMAEMLPREQQGILASCNPIPPLVRQQLNELHLIILKAREWIEEKLRVPASHLKISESELQTNVKVETSLNCPHDLPQAEDGSLPTLIQNFSTTDEMDPSSTMPDCVNLKKAPDLSAFALREDHNGKTEANARMKAVQQFMELMISPFQRFKLVEESSGTNPVAEEKATLGSANPQAASQHAERVHDHFKSLLTRTQGSEDRSPMPDNPPNQTDVADTREVQARGLEEQEEEEKDEPLSKQLPRKRKRKSQRALPDLALSTLSQVDEGQSQQGRPAEFQSFDYEEARQTLFREREAGGAGRSKKDRKRSFDPNDNRSKNKRGRFMNRNRRGKSMTYGSTSQIPNRTQWPKR